MGVRNPGYNKGAVVEQRIEEIAQLSAGRTAVDDLDGNALLWSLAVVAYQTLHTLREQCLSGSWRKAHPRRIRLAPPNTCGSPTAIPAPGSP